MEKAEDSQKTASAEAVAHETGMNGSEASVDGNSPETDTVKDPLQEAIAVGKEWEKKFLYLSAEFDNYRKRMQKEKMDFLKFGHEDFLRDQLQFLDNFERALLHAKSFEPEKQSPFGQVLQGIEMIMVQFVDSLKQQGVIPIKTEGQKFDPLLHEAVAQESSNEAEPGFILKDLQKGYLLHGRLLRAARVIIAKKDL